MKLKFFSLFILASSTLLAQTVTTVNQAKSTSLRGLSVVNNKIAWVSGSNGTVGITTDAGITWKWQQIKGFEKADFRDIEAFSNKDAVIMSSGMPALVLKTTDGGISWQIKYQNNNKAYFLDAMDFKDGKTGYILGDPIDGKFLLLETKNAGDTWVVVNNAPVALTNEAAFAASGTCLRVKKLITIVTGGSSSRIISSPINEMIWTAKTLPLTNGIPSRGAFSFATDNNQTVIVGGDYLKNIKTDSVAYLIPNIHATFRENIPVSGPLGYQSCIESLKEGVFLSTGTPGTNLTTDGGKTWRKIDTASYNVCSKARHGRLVLLAGDNGKIGIFNP